MAMEVISLTAPCSGSHMIGFGLGIGTRPTWQRASSGKPRQVRTEDEIIAMLNGWPPDKGIWTHIPHSKKMADYFRERFKAQVFTRRDPRDICVSLGHYVDRFPASTLNWAYDGVRLSQMGWEDRMVHVIEEYSVQLLQFAPWVHEYKVWQVKYEDCIDDREKVFDVLRVNLIAEGLSPPSLDEMVEGSLKRHQLSYRRAKYGDWKYEFNPSLTDHARKHLTGAMEAYGYEW